MTTAGRGMKRRWQSFKIFMNREGRGSSKLRDKLSRDGIFPPDLLRKLMLVAIHLEKPVKTE